MWITTYLGSNDIKIVIQASKHGANFHYFMREMCQPRKILQEQLMVNLQRCSVDKVYKVSKILQKSLVFNNIHQCSVCRTSSLKPFLLSLLLSGKWIIFKLMKMLSEWLIGTSPAKHQEFCHRILHTTTDDSQWKESMLPTQSSLISLMLQTASC